MCKGETFFKVYSVLCLNNRATGDYTYLVLTTGGGLSYFTSSDLPAMVKKFLQMNNDHEHVFLLDWQSYIVFADQVPQSLRDG